MGQSQRERERGGEESKERGGARRGTTSADKREGEESERRRESVWTMREKHRQRGERREQ